MLERLAGNDSLKHDLTTALQSGRLPHSILLVGEEGCGTGFAARCLAADFMYPDNPHHAEAVLRGEDSECLSLRGDGASGQIKIGKEQNPEPNTVRWARSEIQRSALSTDARGRVLFIYGAHNLNDASANALLKIIEEPPADVLFLFTAPSMATVMATIRSRCAAYTVAPVEEQLCTRTLRAQNRQLTETQAAELSFLYEGHIGRCLAAVEQPKRRNALEDARKLCAAASQKDAYTALSLLTRCERDREAALELLWQLTQLCSACLRRPGFGGYFAGDAPKAARCIRCADDARQKINANVNLRIVLAVLAGALCE